MGYRRCEKNRYDENDTRGRGRRKKMSSVVVKQRKDWAVEREAQGVRREWDDGDSGLAEVPYIWNIRACFACASCRTTAWLVHLLEDEMTGVYTYCAEHWPAQRGLRMQTAVHCPP